MKPHIGSEVNFLSAYLPVQWNDEFHIYISHHFAAREGMKSTNWPRSQRVASQLSWSSIAPVSRRSWVRILQLRMQKLLLVDYHSESRAKSRIWNVLPNMVFPPIWGKKKWRNFEHAHASYPGLFFSPAWVQPLYGAGRKESSGTGLVEALIFFRLLPSNCLSWKFTAMITLHFLLTKVGYVEDKKIIIMVFIMYFYHNQFKNTLQLFKVAQYSFQHLYYLDGSL